MIDAEDFVLNMINIILTFAKTANWSDLMIPKPQPFYMVNPTHVLDFSGHAGKQKVTVRVSGLVLDTAFFFLL